MAREEGELEGVGGLRLFRQAWIPDGEVRAVVALAHGGGEHSGRYAWVGEQLTQRGYALHALDHRGHGRSQGARAYVDRMANAVTDLDALVDAAVARHPGRPLFLLGHSMGGCIALRYAMDHQERLSGLVLSAPVASAASAPAALRLVGRVLSAVAPRAGVLRIDSKGVSNDPAMVAAYEQDPLNFHGKLPARTLLEMSRAIDSFPEAVNRITIPLLVMHSPDDTIVAYAGAEMVHANAGSADKALIRYDGLAHELLNEPERDRVLADIAGWLDARA